MKLRVGALKNKQTNNKIDKWTSRLTEKERAHMSQK